MTKILTRHTTLRHLGQYGLVLALGLLPRPAAATTIDYSFRGVLGAIGGGSLNLGNGTVIDLSGAAFTVTGHTISDVDFLHDPTDVVGMFAATATYDFGALGSFTTDAGGTRYTQVASCWGGKCGNDLQTLGGNYFLNVVAGDPTTLAANGVLYFFPPFDFATNDWTNAGHQELQLSAGSTSGRQSIVNEATVTMAPVPEPATLVLLTMGIGAFLVRHRGRRGTNS
jgi:hypothetical protein